MSELLIDSVTKSYDNKVLLSDIFISCQKGEITGLIGRNGSGKSALLKIIFGIENSDSKFVRIGNKVLKKLSDGKNLIKYLPQHNFLPNNISIRSLIHLFIEKENRKIVFENEFLKPLLHKKNQNLSGGERRIVAFLLIVHSDAEFILLDEPFNGVSPTVRDYIITYIKKMKSSKGFIITDHNYESIVSLADTLVYLQNGYLKKINDKSELIALGYITKWFKLFSIC